MSPSLVALLWGPTGLGFVGRVISDALSSRALNCQFSAYIKPDEECVELHVVCRDVSVETDEYLPGFTMCGTNYANLDLRNGDLIDIAVRVDGGNGSSKQMEVHAIHCHSKYGQSVQMSLDRRERKRVTGEVLVFVSTGHGRQRVCQLRFCEEGNVLIEVSHRWEDLARKLGFSPSETKAIRSSEPDDDHRCEEMLNRWRNSEGSKATLQVLKQALIDIGETSTAGHIEALKPIELRLGGPEMRALYDRACKEGTCEVFNTILMLVGKHGNGKSSLKNSLLQLAFNEDKAPTEGIVITPCLMMGNKEWKVIQGVDSSLELAHSAAMTMKRMIKEKKEPHKMTDGEESKPAEPEQHSPGDTESAVEACPAGHIEERAATKPEKYNRATQIVHGKDDLSNIIGSKEHPALSIWDFAGHDVFYSNHHVFYTHYAIYILALKLTTPLDSGLESDDCVESLQLETEGDLVDYHLESIRAHTRPKRRNVFDGEKVDDKEPRVVVVGTNKDQVKQTREIKVFCDKVRAHLKGKAIGKHVIDKYFAIDNKKRDPEDPELSNLRDCILKIAQEQSHMGRRIPISWLELKSKLMEMKKKDMKYCTIQDVVDATDSSHVPEEDVVIILRFFHLCGDILYFNTNELRDFVILDPQWFVDVQKTIITIPEFRLEGEIEQWERLENEGVLEDTLIDAVWKKKQRDLNCDLIAKKDKLLKMMEEFDMVLRCSPESEDETSAATSSPEETTYFVPSLLTTEKDEAMLYPEGSVSSKPLFVKFPGKFCPIGLYHRLLIACMRRYKHKPLAYASCSRFIYNKKQTFVITKERHYLKVELLSSVKEVEESVCFSHGPSVREGLDLDLWRIIDDWIPGISYEWGFRCCCENHKKPVKREKGWFLPIRVEEIEEWFKEGEAGCETYVPATTSIEDIGLAHWFETPHEDAEESSNVLPQERAPQVSPSPSEVPKKKGQTSQADHEAGPSVATKDPVARGPKVLLLNDEYGTSKGGVSTINLQAGQILTAANAVVYATALRVPKRDQEAADRDGIHLIQPVLLDEESVPTLDWLTKYHSVHFPHLPQDITCIIGHADITDTAARNIWEQRYPQADLLTFTHVLPEDTEYYKGGRKAMKAWEKERDMLDKVDNAKAAFSVGPRIFDHYDTKYKGEKKPQDHYIFLPKPSELFLAKNVSPGGRQKVVLSIGRVRKAEKQKGHDLTAQSMGDVKRRIPNVKWDARGISEDDWETSKKILEDNLNSPDLNPNLMCYGTQEDILNDMMTAHVVLMPSRSEPFGLVGLEAIAAGIPVLISNQTGLAQMILDLIAKKKLSAEHRSVIVETSVNDSDRASVVKRWADKIVKILTYSDSEFEKAARLKQQLVASKYWEESHRTFLQACGVTGVPAKQFPQGTNIEEELQPVVINEKEGGNISAVSGFRKRSTRTPSPPYAPVEETKVTGRLHTGDGAGPSRMQTESRVEADQVKPHGSLQEVLPIGSLFNMKSVILFAVVVVVVVTYMMQFN